MSEKDTLRTDARHLATYGYVSRPNMNYMLVRDGKELMRGDESAIFRWIHNNCHFSLIQAVKYEGYRIIPIDLPGERRVT